MDNKVYNRSDHKTLAQSTAVINNVQFAMDANDFLCPALKHSVERYHRQNPYVLRDDYIVYTSILNNLGIHAFLDEGLAVKLIDEDIQAHGDSLIHRSWWTRRQKWEVFVNSIKQLFVRGDSKEL